MLRSEHSLNGDTSENLHTHHRRPPSNGRLPCIRSLRISVATVVGMVGYGIANKELLDAYPDLEIADVREALRYAAEAVRERAPPRW